MGIYYFIKVTVTRLQMKVCTVTYWRTTFYKYKILLKTYVMIKGLDRSSWLIQVKKDHITNPVFLTGLFKQSYIITVRAARLYLRQSNYFSAYYGMK